MTMVLIVDDDAMLTRALGRMCRLRGLDHLVANNGLEALTMLAERDDVKLVLSDVRMPVMDGPSFLARLVERGPLPCPVIFLTGYSDSDPEHLVSLGAAEVYAKPMRATDLLDVVARHLAA